MNEFISPSFDLSAHRESGGQGRSSKERDKEQRDNNAYEAGERQQVRILSKMHKSQVFSPSHSKQRPSLCSLRMPVKASVVQIEKKRGFEDSPL